jgi:photosystem II stability/assembly factor-like uncharacterized protein
LRSIAGFVFAACALLGAAPPRFEKQFSGSTAELRGLAVRDAKTAWATGSQGTVLRTRDGKTWEKVRIPGGEELDFRDVELPSANVVVLLAAGPGDKSRIYRSADAGATWKLVHTNPDPDGFYDAIAFWDDKSGLLVGDPVKGMQNEFRVLLTADGGATWTPIGLGTISFALKGEGIFAASGTCLTTVPGGKRAWFVTGGARVSRVFRTLDGGQHWNSSAAPVPAGNPSSGLFSVAFFDDARGFASGGDYKQPTLASLNGIRSDDGGKTWIAAPISMSGFYSAVVTVPGASGRLVAAGPVGIAVSDDAGKSWASVDTTPLNAIAFGSDGAGWAVGPKGTIARVERGR